MSFELKLATEQDIIESCRDCTDQSVVIHPESWADWADYCLAAGPAYSGWYGGQLVGCAGLHIVRPHVANGWLLYSGHSAACRRSVTYVRALVKVLTGMFPALQETYELRSIRTFSVKGFGQSQKLLRAIGFKKLRHETDKRFYYRWVG